MSQADAIYKALLVNVAAIQAHADLAEAMGDDGKQAVSDNPLADQETKEKAQGIRELTGSHYRRLLEDLDDPAWFPNPKALDAVGLDLSGLSKLLAGFNLPSLIAAGLKQAGTVVEGLASKTPA